MNTMGVCTFFQGQNIAARAALHFGVGPKALEIARKRRQFSWLGGAMTDALERFNIRCGGSCRRWTAAGLFAIFVFFLQLFSERFTGAVALVLLAYFVFYFVMSLGRQRSN